MTPAGYMTKRVSPRPDSMRAARVEAIHSLSACISKNFADYIQYWKHNGFWLFDSPQIIRELSREHGIDLAGTTLFFYEVHELEFDADARAWRSFAPCDGIAVRAAAPAEKNLEGYDVATFYARAGPECSPLSCNGLAEKIETNRHCLLDSADAAKRLLEEGQFDGAEPGPYRIFAVYAVAWD